MHTSSPPVIAATNQGSGGVAVALQEWSVMPTMKAIASGPVTFTVTNDGQIPHEFVVLRTDTPGAAIPITSFEGEAGRINESTVGTNVGETGDLQPGASKTVTINLPADHYVFVCNLPGHFHSGMHLDF